MQYDKYELSQHQDLFLQTILLHRKQMQIDQYQQLNQQARYLLLNALPHACLQQIVQQHGIQEFLPYSKYLLPELLMQRPQK
ncbi:Uncharacterised protein [Acinetobacter baumannii]|nr:Uncharacterised protein [Acinetobacter baumannii]